MRVAIITESFPPDVNGVANSVLRSADTPARARPRAVGRRPPAVHGHAPGARPAALSGGADPVRAAAGVPGVPARACRSGRSPPPSATTAPRSCTWPARSSSARGGCLGRARAGPAGGRGVPDRRRRVCPRVPDGLGPRRSPGVGCAACTPAPPGRWPRRPRPRPTLVAHGVRRRVALAARASTRRRSTRRTATSGSGARSPRTARCSSATSAGSPPRSGSTCSRRRPGCRASGWSIVGDGPGRGGAAPGAAGRRSFVGERHGSQLARLFASLDVFVHTGPFETFCQAIQEAMASGVPVVAPAAGGPLDLVQPRPHRLSSCRPATAPRWPRRWRRWRPTRPCARAFGRAARADVEERTWAAVGDELIDHYRA